MSYAVPAFAAACDTIVLAMLMLTSLLPFRIRMATTTVPLLSLAVMQNKADIARELAAAGADLNALFA